MWKKVRREILVNLDAARDGDISSKLTDIFLIALIAGNVVAVMFETVDSIYAKHAAKFELFEKISVIIFTVEYILRLWCCVEYGKYKNPLRGRLAYIFSWSAMIDLLAILPYYAFALDLRILRSLRLFRMIRIMKIGRYSEALSHMGGVLRAKKEEL